MKHTEFDEYVLLEVDDREYGIIENVRDLMGKPRTETIEELFLYPPKEEYNVFTVLPFQGPLTLVYESWDDIADILEIEKEETLELYTNCPNEPFYESQLQLLVIKDAKGNAMKKYYIEKELYEPEEDRLGEVYERAEELGIDLTEKENIKFIFSN